MMNISRNFKVICIALLVSLSVAVTGCSGGNKEADEFKSILKEGNYYEAMDYYASHKDAIGEENTNAVLDEIREEIVSSYRSGSLTASVATSNLSSLSSIANSATQQKISQSIELIKSNENFENGNKAFTNREFESAKSLFRSVIESDENYASAQEKIAECDNEIKKIYIAKAEKYANDGNYKAAIEYLKSYLSVFDDVTDLNAKIKEYTDAQMEVLLKETNQFIKNGDYYSALEEIGKLSQEYPDSDKLKKTKQETEEKYLKDIIPLIDEYKKDKKYSEAYMICKNALDLIPESEELKKRLEEIEPLKPVLLNEMKISESDAFEQISDHRGTYEDVVGNKYEAGNLYKLALYHDGWGNDDDGYAKVFLNSQYTKMDGVIAVSNDSDKGDFIVKILCDDKELYSGKFNRTTPPQKVSIDVKGRKWMQVMISYANEEDDGFHCYALLSQFGFTK